MKHLRKVVFCSGDMKLDLRLYLNKFTPYGYEDHPQAVQIAFQLLREVPQLLAVGLGLQEWRQDGKRYAVGDNQDEWRDRAWWN